MGGVDGGGGVGGGIDGSEEVEVWLGGVSYY